MIHIKSPSDINSGTITAVAYERERLEIAPDLLAAVDQSRETFNALIDSGVACYGVTTGLGKMSTTNLSDEARDDISKNMMMARAVAFGVALPRPVARAMMMIRLVNFLSGQDGVSSQLCRYIVSRLNDDFDPFVPSQGHGFAADGTPNAHCFQTLIGEGRVLDDRDASISAAVALSERNQMPYELAPKEGLALINGITALPAYAIYAHRQASALHRFSNRVAALSMDAIASPKDSIHPALAVGASAGVSTVIDDLNEYLRGSTVQPYKLQAAVSLRIIPQVHGAHADALSQVQSGIEQTIQTFSGNPMLVNDGGEGAPALLSVGSFHNQFLVNLIEYLAISTAHVICLSERRLHRMMDENQTGLNPQLAPRPGLDAGMVVAHKACIDLTARIRMAAQPLSLMTSETSGGQEDYMSMAVPVIQRLLEIVRLGVAVLTYEALAGCVALDQRQAVFGAGVTELYDFVRAHIPPLDKDRSPGEDFEIIHHQICGEYFAELDLGSET